MGILDFLTQRVDSTKLARTNEKLMSLYDEEDKAIQNLWDIRNKIQKAKTDIEQMAKEEAKQQQEQPKPEEKPTEETTEPKTEVKPEVKPPAPPAPTDEEEENLFAASAPGENVEGAPIGEQEKQTPYGVSGGKSKKSKKNKSKKEKKQTQKGGKTRKNKKSQNGGQQLPLSPSEFPDTPLI